jgi:hypothetical protein
MEMVTDALLWLWLWWLLCVPTLQFLSFFSYCVRFFPTATCSRHLITLCAGVISQREWQSFRRRHDGAAAAAAASGYGPSGREGDAAYSSVHRRGGAGEWVAAGSSHTPPSPRAATAQSSTWWPAHVSGTAAGGGGGGGYYRPGGTAQAGGSWTDGGQYGPEPASGGVHGGNPVLQSLVAREFPSGISHAPPGGTQESEPSTHAPSRRMHPPYPSGMPIHAAHGFRGELPEETRGSTQASSSPWPWLRHEHSAGQVPDYGT